MKKRDIYGLVIAFILVASTVIIIYTQFAPVPSDSSVKVEVPPKVAVPLDDDKSQASLEELRGRKDFANPPESCTDNPALCGR